MITKILYRWWARLIISLVLSSMTAEIVHIKTGREIDGLSVLLTITLYILLSILSGFLNKKASRKKELTSVIDEDINNLD